MPLLLADFIHSRRCKPNLRKNVDTTGAYGELYFRVENLYNSGYNKINPNRRLEDERSG